MARARTLSEMLAIERRISRRRLLQNASLAVAGLAIAACADDEPQATPTPQPEPTPTPVLVEAVPGYDDPTRWEGQTLYVTSWGGEYQDAQTRAFFEPFERLTGATLNVAVTDIDELRSQVDSGDVSWDVCDVLTEDVLPLANLGVVAPIDYSAMDTTQIVPEAMMEHGLTSGFYSEILSYRTDIWDPGEIPSSWADFWDAVRFPGPRGLHRDPQGTLEFALLADGVRMADLYPLDVERALAKLDEIREHVFLWWEQGAQPSQAVTSGDIVMLSVWNSRIERLSTEDAPVDVEWNGGAISGDSWVITSGAPQPEMALDFLNFASRPEPGAAFASVVPFGPVNRGSFDLLTPDQRLRLPTAPDLMSQQFLIDQEWWFANREAAGILFEEWLAAVE